ncbi:MAG: hypothetical protein FJX75_03600 [Armatimonadetes bacterium]|nr:hypothetical protein [Armatimonadota bacterium]
MSRSSAVEVSPEPTVLEERRLIGRLVTLGPGPDARAELQQGDRAYACPSGPEQAERLASLSGEWVVVRAACRVVKHDDREDDILELLDIEEVALFDSTPLVVRELALGATVLRFVTPIEVEPRPADNLVALDYPPLGIMAAGETRAEAVAAFLEELGWLWETYVQADEARLAEDALELRATFLQMVRTEAS